MKEYLEDKTALNEVMVFLKPQLKHITSLMVDRNFEEVNAIKKRVDEGIKRGYIHFTENEKLDIDLKDIELKRGKEWRRKLEQQLKIIADITGSFG